MRLLRVKPEHALYRLPGGQIHIGEQSLGAVAEIEDPTGCVWTLLRAMDGSRDAAEIVDHVTQRHPGESPVAVKAAIAALMEAGYVEICGAPDPPDPPRPNQRQRGTGERRRITDPFRDRPHGTSPAGVAPSSQPSAISAESVSRSFLRARS